MFSGCSGWVVYLVGSVKLFYEIVRVFVNVLFNIEACHFLKFFAANLVNN